MSARVPFDAPHPGQAEQQLARDASVGGVIADKYRVDGTIGRGGMGFVIAATHLALGRRVAIKLIRDELLQDQLVIGRMLREAKAAASIQSEHVARVLDVGMLPSGAPFIVMEYLEGLDLAAMLRRDGRMAVSEAVDFILQACEALAEAHRNGIIHRDLKPANLFIARQPGGVPCVKVVDFGISKIMGLRADESLTQPTRVVGSMFHMAPEQMRGKAVDERTDIWAIGVLLFEMVTGRSPFPGDTWADICAQVLSGSTPSLLGADGVPKGFSSVVQRCLSYAADNRYSNVAELAASLAPFGTHGAQASLARISRLASTTGEMAAAVWTPAPPLDLARGDRQGLPHVESPTPVVTPSAEESAATRKPVVSSILAPATIPAHRALWGALLAALTALVGAALVRYTHPASDPPTLGVPSPPSRLAPAPEAAPAPMSDGSASKSREAIAGGPRGPVVRPVFDPVPPTPPPRLAPTVKRDSVDGVQRSAASPPAPAASEIIRELPDNDPVWAASPSTAPAAAAEPAHVKPLPPMPDGVARAVIPGVVAPSVPSPPPADVAAAPIDPWDLSSVTFKRKAKAAR